MKYLQFNFRTSPCTEVTNDVLSATLADVGFESFMEQPGGIAAYIQKDLYDEHALRQALDDFPLPDARIDYDFLEAEDRDWNEEWERNFFQPIIIGNRCVVHSTFHHDVPQAEYDITIDPQMAFGTGHHETTGLIINELLDTDLAGRDVLDMGCGTSILAILARMRGATRCTAIDIDDWCVRNSLENIRLNRLDGIDVSQGDASSLADKGPFDVIIANINRNILLNDLPAFASAMRGGSRLLLSGFYTADCGLLIQKAQSLGLSYTDRTERDGWASLQFIRQDS